MNFTTIGEEIAGNEVYSRRVEYALYVAAVNVMSEDAGALEHAKRVTFATEVLSGRASIRSAVSASLTNPSLTSASNANAITDSDLQFTINSLFNALAGIGT